MPFGVSVPFDRPRGEGSSSRDGMAGQVEDARSIRCGYTGIMAYFKCSLSAGR